MQADYRNDGKVSITQVVLAGIAGAGLITMAVLAPNSIQALKLLRKKKTYANPRQQISNTVYRLIRQGYVAVRSDERGARDYFLTVKGDRQLHRRQLMNKNSVAPRRWDGKWRVIIFDIYEKRKATRDWFRLQLRTIGFIKLQHSVWIFPYECEEVIALLKIDQQLGDHVLYMVVDRLENDAYLRRKFRLH